MGDSGGVTYELRPNPDAKVKMRRTGEEGHPLLVIDDFALDPDALVDIAAASPFHAPETTWYPGVNADTPDAYLDGLLNILMPSLRRGFGFGDVRLRARSFFALSTKPLAELVPLQRIPHYDQTNPDCLAILHYLGRDQTGGTGFFRHKSSGFEAIDPGRRDAYRQMVDADLAAIGDRLDRFTGPDTPNYEMIDQVEPQFNRLVIYRSNVLHCALFDGARLSEDPRIGRLTANSFVEPA